MKLGFVKLTANAFDPVKGSLSAAGYDLKSPYESVVSPHGKALIKTDLAFEMPRNTYGRIAPRSGLALHYFIDVGAGVIDRDFTGNVSVLLFNHSDYPFAVKRGDKIAQIIFETISELELVELDAIVQTDRGTQGFGSTG